MNAIIFGHNSVNATGLIRSLGRKGHNVYAILHKDLINYSAKSKYVKRVWYVEGRSEWLETIKSACKEIGGLIVLFSAGDDEAKFINSHQEELEGFCVVEGVSDVNVRHLYFHKDYVYKLAHANNLQLINTCFITNKSDPLPDFIEYPVIVKALDSTCGGKDIMCICDTSNALSECLDKISTEFYPVQLQPFIMKEKEVMLQGCSLSHGRFVLAPVCFVKTRFCGYGNGYGSYGYSVEVAKDKELSGIARKVANIISTIGYQGLYSAEFLYANGNYYFLEINFRNDGTPIVSTESGYNLPDIYCRFIEGPNSIEMTDTNFCKIYYMHIDDFMHVLYGDISLFKWVKDVMKKDCYWYMLDRNDLLPFFLYFCFRIKRKLYNFLNK